MNRIRRLARLEAAAEAGRRKTLPIMIRWELASPEAPPAAAHDSRKPSSVCLALTRGSDNPPRVDEASDPEPFDTADAAEDRPRCPRGHVQRGQRCGSCIREDRERWPGLVPGTPFVSEMLPTTFPGRGRGRVRVIVANWNPHTGLRR